MVHCVVPLCKSDFRSCAKQNKKISFHEIPSDNALRLKWISAISREGVEKGSQWVPNQYCRVCSLHFINEDFKQCSTRRMLKVGTIPSIFPWCRTKKQKKPPLKKQKIVHECAPVEKSKQSEICAVENLPPAETTAVINDDSTVNIKNALSYMKYLSSNNKTPPLKNQKIIHEYAPVDKSKQSETCTTENLSPVETTPVLNNDTCLKNVSNTKNALFYRKYRNLSSSFSKMKRKFLSLKRNYDLLLTKHEEVNNITKELNINEIIQLSKNNEVKALFVLDQLKSHTKKKPRWSEATVRSCLMWYSRSPSNYNYVSNLGFLKLPCISTLQKYLASRESSVNQLEQSELTIEEPSKN